MGIFDFRFRHCHSASWRFLYKGVYILSNKFGRVYLTSVSVTVTVPVEGFCIKGFIYKVINVEWVYLTSVSVTVTVPVGGFCIKGFIY